MFCKLLFEHIIEELYSSWLGLNIARDHRGELGRSALGTNLIRRDPQIRCRSAVRSSHNVRIRFASRHSEASFG